MTRILEDEQIISLENHGDAEHLRPFSYEDRLELDWLTARYEQSTQDVIGTYRARYIHISREER